MPLLTPSRIAVVVIAISLISFLWTFGLPHRLAEPSLPIIEHPADEVKLHDPIAPAPVVHTPHTTPPKVTPTPTLPADQPKQEDDHRWDDKTRKASHTGVQTLLPGPKETGAVGHDEDGGRWNDQEKPKDSAGKGKASAAAAPTTLVVEVSPAPAAPNTTTATPAPSSSSAPALHSTAPVLALCKDVRNAPHVMVVIKTSKAEIHNKLSAHLLGLLSCVPNFAIFSDHAGEIDGNPVHDALHNISSAAKQKYDEFSEYKIITADPEYKPDAKKTKDLDKWKFLPMVYQAYQMNPHAKFYAFIEADTGLSWTNLLQWVDRLDYRIPYYSGAQSFLNKVQFAQRGSGILLSQGALRRYAKSYDERYLSEWEARVGKECCGDMVLATALADAHVELYTSWPLIQGEQPNTLDYTPKQWCAPAVSWHHMDNDALRKSWDMQKKWTETHGWEKPYLYQNAFEDYVQPHLVAQRENWDNIGSDTKITAQRGHQKQTESNDEHRAGEKSEKAASPPHRREDNKENKKPEGGKEATDWAKISTMVEDGAENPERCKNVCAEVEDCLQWRHTVQNDGECHLSKVIKLGRATGKKEGVQQWTSGWMVDRIKDTVKKWECKKVNWKFYQ
ncbi:transmembrane transport [Ascochyta rabiei]|uniref:Transmembrane transport n=1 Tax=Didymella rabiei TaxID=5454 RepID=A0A163K7Y0_DIDRA|nr:transmembrane transport [Ascochyta rabiei]